MIYDVVHNSYTLTTGRRFYANRGIVGLGPQAGDLSSGYDDGIELERDWDPEFPPWTVAERRELADEMIRRWERFKRVGQAEWPHENEPD